MEISLVRHGKSKQIENYRLTSLEFQDWVNKYDTSGVFEENNYPQATLEKAAAANLLVTSDLKRSIESASLLRQQKRVISDSLYREVELPVLSGTWRIRLCPNSWAIFLRCLWYSGYARQCESLLNAKQRAERAAIQLENYAEKHHSVVLVGHGIFNRLIAEELKRKGWKGDRKTSAKHWNCTTYSF